MNFFDRYYTLFALAGSGLITVFQLFILNVELPEDRIISAIQFDEIILPQYCHFTSNPEILRNDPGAFLQVWIEVNRPVFNEPVLPESESLHQFRNQIGQILNTDPIVILENQLEAVSGGDSLNVELVLKGNAGTWRIMNCLEGVLLSVLTDRTVDQGSTMYANPTEFLSYVLSKGDSLKIYFYTVDQPGIRGLSIFTDLLDQDLASGWSVSQNIHNHNFFPGTGKVLGGVVPSATDIGNLRNTAIRYGFSRATITNGFHSIDMTQDDFVKFSDGSSDGSNE